MKRWNTVQQFALEIAELEKSENKELNIAQCCIIARNVKNLYREKGKDGVVNHIRETLPTYHTYNGFSMEQKDSVERIIKKLFKNHWSPFSRIRNNMIRIGAVK